MNSSSGCDNYNMNRETISFKFAIPRRDELYSFVCLVNPSRNQTNQSIYHCTIMKCRLLLFIFPTTVIGTPVKGCENKIHFIATKTFFASMKFQNLLIDLNVSIGNPTSVTFQDYVACIKFTIGTKIAPHWNKIGDYYVKGRRFFFMQSFVEVIKFDISINDGEVCLQLKASRVKIPFLKFEDLGMTENMMRKFQFGGPVNLSTNTGMKWVHVIPSLKKAQIVSVSKNLPKDGVFENYNQLRRHWKNMYGYRLPKTDEDIVYYVVKFYVRGPKYMTYPNICLTIEKPISMPGFSTEATVSSFLEDMARVLPEICNKSLFIQNPDTYSLNSKSSTSVEDSQNSKTKAIKNISPLNGSKSSTSVEDSQNSKTKAIKNISPLNGSSEGFVLGCVHGAILEKGTNKNQPESNGNGLHGILKNILKRPSPPTTVESIHFLHKTSKFSDSHGKI